MNLSPRLTDAPCGSVLVLDTCAAWFTERTWLELTRDLLADPGLAGLSRKIRREERGDTNVVEPSSVERAYFWAVHSLVVLPAVLDVGTVPKGWGPLIAEPPRPGTPDGAFRVELTQLDYPQGFARIFARGPSAEATSGILDDPLTAYLRHALPLYGDDFRLL